MDNSLSVHDEINATSKRFSQTSSPHTTLVGTGPRFEDVDDTEDIGVAPAAEPSPLRSKSDRDTNGDDTDDRVTQLHEQLEDALVLLDTRNARISELEQEVANARAAHVSADRAAADSIALDERNYELEMLNHQLSEKITNMEQELIHVKAAHRATNEELIRISADSAALHAASSDSRKLVDDAELRFADEVARLQKQVRRLESEKIDLAASATRNITEYDDLKASIEKVTVELNDSRATAQQATELVNSLQQTLAEKDDLHAVAINAVREQQMEVEKQLVEANSIVQELQSSLESQRKEHEEEMKAKLDTFKMEVAQQISALTNEHKSQVEAMQIELQTLQNDKKSSENTEEIIRLTSAIETLKGALHDAETANKLLKDENMQQKETIDGLSFEIGLLLSRKSVPFGNNTNIKADFSATTVDVVAKESTDSTDDNRNIPSDNINNDISDKSSELGSDNEIKVGTPLEELLEVADSTKLSTPSSLYVPSQDGPMPWPLASRSPATSELPVVSHTEDASVLPVVAHAKDDSMVPDDKQPNEDSESPVVTQSKDVSELPVVSQVNEDFSPDGLSKDGQSNESVRIPTKSSKRRPEKIPIRKESMSVVVDGTNGDQVEQQSAEVIASHSVEPNRENVVNVSEVTKNDVERVARSRLSSSQGSSQMGVNPDLLGNGLKSNFRYTIELDNKGSKSVSNKLNGQTAKFLMQQIVQREELLGKGTISKRSTRNFASSNSHEHALSRFLGTGKSDAEARWKEISFATGLDFEDEKDIDALISTMSGGWFQKFNRHGKNPQPRYVWINPYARTINWSIRPPNQYLRNGQAANVGSGSYATEATNGGAPIKSLAIGSLVWDEPETNVRRYPPQLEHLLRIGGMPGSSRKEIVLVPTSWQEHDDWIRGVALLLARSAEKAPKYSSSPRH